MIIRVAVLLVSLCVVASGCSAWRMEHSETCSLGSQGHGSEALPPEGKSWFGASVGGAPQDEAAMDRFTKTAGSAPALYSWFTDWTSTFPTKQIRSIEDRGALPVITWEPIGRKANDPDYAPAVVAGGRYDEYLRQWAELAKAWCGTVLVRLAHEMNGNWYNVGKHGTTADDFIAMRRHVVELFRTQGATNVLWVWSPNMIYGGAPAEPKELYPGVIGRLGRVEWI